MQGGLAYSRNLLSRGIGGLRRSTGQPALAAEWHLNQARRFIREIAIPPKSSHAVEKQHG